MKTTILFAPPSMKRKVEVMKSEWLANELASLPEVKELKLDQLIDGSVVVKLIFKKDFL